MNNLFIMVVKIYMNEYTSPQILINSSMKAKCVCMEFIRNAVSLNLLSLSLLLAFDLK